MFEIFAKTLSAIYELIPNYAIAIALFTLLAMVTAAAIAIALSSGAILGEYLAQPVRREARRLENRLAGPRMVGPHIGARLRRRRRRARAAESRPGTRSG